MTSVPPLAANATLRWSVVKPVLERLQPRRILEIGCGQGGFGARMASHSEYVGVEMDYESFRVAEARVSRAGGRVMLGSLDVLGDPRPFDLVCAFEVLEHIEFDVDAVAEWSRYLGPEGAVLVSVPAWPNRFGAWDSLVGHYRRYTPDELRQTLSQAGLRDIEHTMYGWPLGYLTEPVRNAIARRSRHRGTDSMEDRTATSGRSLQIDGILGRAVMTAASPFSYAQRLRPASGTGIVGLGRR
jgi:SAM-dependent methyltransferase